MKIKFNNKEVGELTEIQKKVIQYNIPKEEFDSDMTRRCKYWLESPCDKFAHVNKKEIKKRLFEKKILSFPIKPIRLMRLYCDNFPCKHGYDDIKGKLQCNVGDQQFELDEDYRMAWRKLCEKDQDKLAKSKYMEQEEKMLGQRMSWILKHKYERCYQRMLLEWEPKLLARGIEELPITEEEVAALIFSQPDYKDRDAREEDARIAAEALKEEV